MKHVETLETNAANLNVHTLSPALGHGACRSPGGKLAAGRGDGKEGEVSGANNNHDTTHGSFLSIQDSLKIMNILKGRTFMKGAYFVKEGRIHMCNMVWLCFGSPLRAQVYNVHEGQNV